MQKAYNCIFDGENDFGGFGQVCPILLLLYCLRVLPSLYRSLRSASPSRPSGVSRSHSTSTPRGAGVKNVIVPGCAIRMPRMPCPILSTPPHLSHAERVTLFGRRTLARTSTICTTYLWGQTRTFPYLWRASLRRRRGELWVGKGCAGPWFAGRDHLSNEGNGWLNVPHNLCDLYLRPYYTQFAISIRVVAPLRLRTQHVSSVGSPKGVEPRSLM